MIQLGHNYTLPEREEEMIPIKVVGVGGAGSNALDRIVLDGMEKADLIAINTDVQSLAASVAAHKVQLGRSVSRGLGTGGDPDLGYQAAAESADEIRQALADARMIFICAGLGGGTGSGATPVVAQLAREAGYWLSDNTLTRMGTVCGDNLKPSATTSTVMPTDSRTQYSVLVRTRIGTFSSQ